MVLIDLKDLYGETAKLADLPSHVANALQLAGEGNEVVLTGSGSVWFYLKIAHALQGKELSVKVVLCGPPHSGKSCLRFGLKEAIKTIPGAPYPYIITACPDGEGSWFQEAASHNSELAATLKAAYKSEFTEDYTHRISESVENCSVPLTLIDIGGIPDAKNEQICASATHAILLAGDLDRLVEWRAFCGKLGLQIITELYSDYFGVSDGSLVLGSDGVYRGSVHHLERGDLSVQQRPTVIHLANILVRMATTEED